MAAASIQRVILSCRHPRDVTGLLQAVFPAWCDNGCWLVSQSVAGVVCGPTPAEAAVALKGLALAARRARLNAVQTQSLVSKGGLWAGGGGHGQQARATSCVDDASRQLLNALYVGGLHVRIHFVSCQNYTLPLCRRIDQRVLAGAPLLLGCQCNSMATTLTDCHQQGLDKGDH